MINSSHDEKDCCLTLKTYRKILTLIDDLDKLGKNTNEIRGEAVRYACTAWVHKISKTLVDIRDSLEDE